MQEYRLLRKKTKTRKPLLDYLGSPCKGLEIKRAQNAVIDLPLELKSIRLREGYELVREVRFEAPGASSCAFVPILIHG